MAVKEVVANDNSEGLILDYMGLKSVQGRNYKHC